MTKWPVPLALRNSDNVVCMARESADLPKK